MSASDAAVLPSERGRLWRIVGASAAFQAGAAAIDSATVVASLVFQLTGSAFAVGFRPMMAGATVRPTSTARSGRSQPMPEHRARN